MTAQNLIDLPGKYRLKVSDYRLLDKGGVFDDFAKTELIEGEIVAVQAQHSPHSRTQTLLLMALSAACERIGNPIQPWVELSVALGEDTEPQPDILLATDLPESGAIAARQVALIVEVAVNTIRTDLGPKPRIYAAAGIPEYWVVDVNARVVHQMWSPDGEAYAKRCEMAFGEPLPAKTITDFVIMTERL